MWNLFKEAFRSLKSAKVTILGLTLLVFLSSSVFVMLSSVRTAYTTKFKDYNKISNLHDLTLDLDLNTEGKMAEEGYKKTVEEMYRVENTKDFELSIKHAGYEGFDVFEKDVFAYDPINGKTKLEKKYDVVDGKNITSEVFDVNELITQFNRYKLAIKNGNTNYMIDFDLKKRTFTPKRDWELSRKQIEEDKDGQKSIKTIEETFELNHNDNIIFDKTVSTINDIGKYDYTQINEGGFFPSYRRYQAWVPTKDVYVNIKTKIATTDVNIGTTWVQMKEGFQINKDYKAEYNVGKNLLGLGKATGQNEYNYNGSGGYSIHHILTNNGNKLYVDSAPLFSNPSGIVSLATWGGASGKTTWGFTNQGNTAIKSSFKWSDAFPERKITQEVAKAVFEKDTEYRIPESWIKEIRRMVVYNKHVYDLTYYPDDPSKPLWTGSYLEFIESLTPDELDKLRNFHFWTKSIITEDQSGNGEVEKFDSMIVYDEVFEKITQIEPDGKDYKPVAGGAFDTPFSTVMGLSTTDIVSDQFYWEFSNATNKTKRSEYVSIIDSGANEITRRNIKGTLEGLVGEDNIGRRQTMTVSSFDQILGKNQVFQFINADSSVNKNVNKMYYEQKTPTELLTLDSKKPFNELWPIKNTPTPSYSISIINAIYDGYKIDPAYYNVEVDFAKTYKNDVESKETKLVKLINQKGVERAILKVDDGKNDPTYELYIPRMNEWVFHKRLTTSQLTIMLSDYSNPFTVKGKVGQKGKWYEESEKNSNIYIPVLYRNLPSHAIDQAVKEGEYTSFLNPLKSVLSGILLVGDEPWMSQEVLDNLVWAANESFKKNHFYSVMTTGTIEKDHMGKIVFDTFYYANKGYEEAGNDQPLLNRLFIEVIHHMKALVMKQGTAAEQKKYLIDEINRLSKLFENAFGISFGNLDILDTILEYVDDPIQFLEALEKFVEGIDAGVWLTQIKAWYDLNYGSNTSAQPIKIYEPDGSWEYEKTQDGKLIYPYFGTRELLIPLFGRNQKGEPTIQDGAFKEGVKSIVNSLNWELIMDKIIDVASKTLTTAEDKATIKKIFTEMNAIGSYSNIKDMVSQLVDQIDITVIAENINYFFSTRDHIFSKEINGEEKWFKSSYVTNVEMMTSIVKGVFSDPSNHDNIVTILIKGLNLSFKVEDNNGFNAPAKEDGKVDLFELQSMEKLSYQKLDDYWKYTNQYVDIYEMSGPSVIPTELLDKVLKYINTFMDVRLSAASPNEHILKYAKKLITTLSILNMNKYTSNDLLAAFGSTPGTGLQENAPRSGSSLADIALWNLKGKNWTTTNTGATVPDPLGVAYEAVKSTIHSSSFAPGSNSLVIYNFYIKLLYEHMMGELAKDTTNSPENIKLQNALESGIELIAELHANATSKSNGSIYNELTTASELENIDDGGTQNMVVTAKVGPNRVPKAVLTPLKYASKIVEHMKNTTFWPKLNSMSETYINSTSETFSQQVALLAWSQFKYNMEIKITVVIEITINQEVKQGTGRFADAIKLLGTKKTSSETNESAKNPLYKLLEGGVDSFEALSRISDSFNAQANVFSSLGLSSTVASTYAGVIFPMVAKAATVAMSKSDPEGGNIGYVLKKQLRNLGEKDRDWYFDKISGIMESKNLGFEVENHGSVTLRMDMYYLEYISKKMKDDESKGEIFDLNLGAAFDSVMDAATEVITEPNIIKFLNVGSYVAKVSETYMLKNKKEAYTQKLPETIEEINSLINVLPSKNLLNINNQKFIILGKETAVDYMYPVLDSANINVDPQNQALVFVNKYGFNRVIQANQGLAISDYLVIKKGNYNGVTINSETGLPVTDEQQAMLLEENPSIEFVTFKKTKEGLRDALNYYVQKRGLSTNLQKAFLATERDPLNPERAMRVTTVQGVIDSVSKLQFYGVLFLVALVGAITVFISQRYIDNRRIVIGIMRAQGYQRSKIALSFIVFSLITALIGGTLGYIAGYSLQKPMMDAFSTFWSVPTDTRIFSWWNMVMTVIVPFIGMSGIIFWTTITILKTKATELMANAAESSTKKYVRLLLIPFKKFSIVTRFRSVLIFNSLWKMLSLTLAMIFTFIVGMFSVASEGVFQKAVTDTYSQRVYSYNIDLFTPTLEGGGVDIVDRNSLESLEQLYIPYGNNLEGNVRNYDYFRPGPSSIMDLDGNITQPGRAHIMSKSSLEISVNAGGMNANPWNIARNSMPDSQYVSALEIAARNAKIMEKTQENFGAEKESFFEYIPSPNNDGKFVYKKWNPSIVSHDTKQISTDPEIRAEFTEFLTKAYQDKNVKDYFMIYGGVDIDPMYDEMYSYANVKMQGIGEMLKITGLNEEQNKAFWQVKPVNNSKEDLRTKLMKYDEDNKPNGSLSNPYAIVVNEVVARKHQLWSGKTVEVKVQNTSDRFSKSVNGYGYQDTFHFKIIDINKTYINNEIFSTQNVVNSITNMDKIKWRNGVKPFNGIFTKYNKPAQAVESLLLYSKSGYYAAMEGVDLVTTSEGDRREMFQNIYSEYGSFRQATDYSDSNVFTKNKINKMLVKAIGDESLANESDVYEKVWNNGNPDLDQVNSALKYYNNLYGTTIYDSAISTIGAKDIEAGFTQNITNTVDSITLAFIFITVVTSIIVLITLSTMIVNENKKKIATFSVMGYNEREKIRMFMYVYLPFVAIAVGVALPLAYATVATFNKLVLVTANMALPLALSWIHIVVAVAIIFTVFMITTSIAYAMIRKIKAIYVLQGDD